jgi:hypothetical protein
MNRPASDRRGPRAFRPSLEMLEDRCLPTVNFAVFGSTLVAFAPTSPSQHSGDTIQFRDNGTQNPGNVVAVSGAPFIPQVAITQVLVFMTGPSETVSYVLAGNLTGTRSVAVSMMNGTDTFAAIVNGSLQSKSNLSFDISAGPSVSKSAPGSAQITGLVNGTVGTGASLSWTAVTTTAAPSLMGFLEVGGVASGANVFVGQFGGNSVNDISTLYAGQMNGTMAQYAVGGAKDDSLTINLGFQGGSSGTLNPSLMLGLGGDDILTFVVHDTNQGVLFGSPPAIDGGSGTNTDFRTTNVLSFNCQNDNIVP